MTYVVTVFCLTSILPSVARYYAFVFLLSFASWENSALPFIKDQSDTQLRPVVSQSQIHRICTELCSSGLGGTPCGTECVDLVPDSLPVVSRDTTNATSPKGYNVSTRQDSCNVLCQNGLGYPFCSCQYDSSKTYNPDYVNICSTFCISYNYQIWGCQACSIYIDYHNFNGNNGTQSEDRATAWDDWCKSQCKVGVQGPACDCTKYSNETIIDIWGCQSCNVYKAFVNPASSDSGDFSLMDATVGQILDWSLWCREVCPQGNGGAACSCDILP